MVQLQAQVARLTKRIKELERKNPTQRFDKCDSDRLMSNVGVRTKKRNLALPGSMGPAVIGRIQNDAGEYRIRTRLIEPITMRLFYRTDST